MSPAAQRALAVGCMVLTVVVGCRSITPPVTYYTLSPLVGEAPPLDGGSAPFHRIGIRSVQLPGIVNRIQMVRQRGAHRVEIASLHRWADYPDRLVQRLLDQNLSLLLPSAQVVTAPWPAGFQADATVDVQIIELIGTTSDTVRLTADWTVQRTGAAAAAHRRSFTESLSGAGYDDLAAAHSRVLGALSRAMADTLGDALMH